MVKSRELVQQTIKGRLTDRIPKGELLIDDGFYRKYLEEQLPGLELHSFEQASLSFAAQVTVLEDLQLDLICLKAGEELGSINQWVRETDIFVFALIEGGFQCSTKSLGFTETLLLSKTDSDSLREAMAHHCHENLILAQKAISAGANGIMLADDIAYSRGTFISPDILRKILFPQMQYMVNEIKKQGVPVFFHADGKLNEVISDLVDAGFDGLQSLEPSAEMDIGQVKKEYGERITLMGNIDTKWLELKDECKRKQATWRLKEVVAETLAAAKSGGRYIFGTCSGLSQYLDTTLVKEMYRLSR